MASLLDNVTTGKVAEPPRLLVYGIEGIGKSTFASHAPAPIFVQTENGLGQINTAKLPLCKSVDDVLACLRAIRDDPHSYQTVVVDSLDFLERLIWTRVCQDFGVRSIEKADGGYGKGYSYALTYWNQVRELLDDIRDRRHMAVILIAHYKNESFHDPEDGDSQRFSPQIHKLACALFCHWCDCVFFAKPRTVRDSETGKSVPVGPEGGERIMYTIGVPTRVAKNRYGMPMVVPFSWAAFEEYLRKASSEAASGAAAGAAASAEDNNNDSNN